MMWSVRMNGFHLLLTKVRMSCSGTLFSETHRSAKHTTSKFSMVMVMSMSSIRTSVATLSKCLHTSHKTKQSPMQSAVRHGHNGSHKRWPWMSRESLTYAMKFESKPRLQPKQNESLLKSNVNLAQVMSVVHFERIWLIMPSCM